MTNDEFDPRMSMEKREALRESRVPMLDLILSEDVDLEDYQWYSPSGRKISITPHATEELKATHNRGKKLSDRVFAVFEASGRGVCMILSKIRGSRKMQDERG